MSVEYSFDENTYCGIRFNVYHTISWDRNISGCNSSFAWKTVTLLFNTISNMVTDDSVTYGAKVSSGMPLTISIGTE